MGVEKAGETASKVKDDDGVKIKKEKKKGSKKDANNDDDNITNNTTWKSYEGWVSSQAESDEGKYSPGFLDCLRIVASVVGAMLDWGVLTFECVEENFERVSRERGGQAGVAASNDDDDVEDEMSTVQVNE